MLTSDDLAPVTPAQRYAWNIARTDYAALAGVDWSTMPRSTVAAEADRLHTLVGTLLHLFEEHFGDPNDGRYKL